VTQAFSIVCVSSQDWDTPLPTNRQQIMARAAARGHEVLFVEIGGFVGFHLWRLLRGPRRAGLARRLVSSEEVAPRIRVVRLLNLIPYGQRFRLCNRINWRIGGILARRAGRLLPKPRVLWIYDPRGADGIGSFGEAFAVYDCVDDYSEQAPPRSRPLVATLDHETAAHSRLVFVTTESLLEHHAAADGRVHLVANVGDFAHFRPAADRAAAPEELRRLPRPVIGFAGNFLESKVDFDLLEDLGKAFPDGTLLLAGPADDAARKRLESLLERVPNGRWLGLQPYDRLPQVLAAFDVGLIPYLDNEYTRSCFPLKLYEYLAAGKPVVAAGVPSVRALEPHVVLTPTRTAFVEAVRKAVTEPDEGAAERIAAAASNTWETRADRLLGLIRAELGE
jgi:glycosyltransferase involved in cell wall biosynthesis